MHVGKDRRQLGMHYRIGGVELAGIGQRDQHHTVVPLLDLQARVSVEALVGHGANLVSDAAMNCCRDAVGIETELGKDSVGLALWDESPGNREPTHTSGESCSLMAMVIPMPPCGCRLHM